MVKMLVLDKKKHDRKSFTCGNAQLDKFLKEQANKAEHEDRSRTKILVDSEIPSQIIGFYTLSYGEIPKAPAGSRLAKYPHALPVLILGRMGVDLKFQKQRVGEQLLLDAIFQVARMKLEKLTTVPVVGLVIDAKNDGIKSFYQKYGFTVMDEDVDPLRLWLPAPTCVEIYLEATTLE